MMIIENKGKVNYNIRCIYKIIGDFLIPETLLTSTFVSSTLVVSERIGKRY